MRTWAVVPSVLTTWTLIDKRNFLKAVAPRRYAALKGKGIAVVGRLVKDVVNNHQPSRDRFPSAWEDK